MVKRKRWQFTANQLTILQLLTVAGVVLGIVLAIGMFDNRGWMRANSPCTSFADWRIEDIPARCFYYFGVVNSIGR